MILVARREEKLIELKKELEADYSIEVRVIAKDLIEENACQEIYDELKKLRVQVNILINNAGF